MPNQKMRTERSPRPSKRRQPRRTRRQTRSTPPPEKPLDLSSIDLSKMINGFYTLRSTLKDLSSSLQRIEKIMDNAYQMFEIANHFVGQGRAFPRRRFRPPLRLVKPNRHEEEEIPRLNLPGPDEEAGQGGSLSTLLQNIDIPQMLKFLQSPFFRQMMTEFTQAKTSGYEADERGRKRKQG
ncbi:hypothetical protein C8P63_11036 [Melghirimyces profundicolus]|uniref:Uncharacterized protein n=1 Tax=Melghirimyces profundicolus TaxID=1242148 RepID=A0A2T6BV20_9BACL|nr:hypothetical protein [Melghirimyces profundicolus]PTX59892.1 hypothetical protein C8P63_11036 [Melghirimyces profundicolus]